MRDRDDVRDVEGPSMKLVARKRDVLLLLRPVCVVSKGHQESS